MTSNFAKEVREKHGWVRKGTPKQVKDNWQIWLNRSEPQKQVDSFQSCNIVFILKYWLWICYNKFVHGKVGKNDLF